MCACVQRQTLNGQGPALGIVGNGPKELAHHQCKAAQPGDSTVNGHSLRGQGDQREEQGEEEGDDGFSDEPRVMVGVGVGVRVNVRASVRL